jgi:predicted amidophosphoribosyltransferase
LNTANQCPVCRARFRGSRFCSRCGADLSPLMLLAAEAWQLRAAARSSLQVGEFERARQLASEAQNLQFTSAGESLKLVSAWLVAQVTAQSDHPMPESPG